MRYPLPYSDLKSLSEAERKRFLNKRTPIEFSHTLTDQMGGLTTLGFVIDGFFTRTIGVGKSPSIVSFLSSLLSRLRLLGSGL